MPGVGDFEGQTHSSGFPPGKLPPGRRGGGGEFEHEDEHGDDGGRGSDQGPRWQSIFVPIAFGVSKRVHLQTPWNESRNAQYTDVVHRRMPATASSNSPNVVVQFFRALRMSHLMLAVNFGVFMLQGAMGGQLLLAGAKVNAEIAAGQIYRLFTPMFLHASVSHLMVNSFSLFSTGPSVEQWFGRPRFLALYLFSGICGNVLSYLCTPTPSVGASGAIFGLVGATAVLLARHRRILGPRSRKGLNSLAYIVLVNFGMGISPASRIDNFGHLGGLLGGMAFAYLCGPRLVPVRGADGRTRLQDRSLLREAYGELMRFAPGHDGSSRKRR